MANPKSAYSVPTKKEKSDTHIIVVWVDNEAGVLASHAKTVAYSYIGPEMTYPIYREGTIGKAKEDLEKSAESLNQKMSNWCQGQAIISVNKALVTQASAAIPVVPLYVSLLYKVMKDNNTHEGCIEQIVRLFKDRLYEGELNLDTEGRIRVDDWEMDPDVQAEVASIWPTVTTENLRELSDFDLYQKEFLELFGFGLDGIDYSIDVEIDRPIQSLSS